MEALKLYINKNLVAPGMSHLPLLFPFWGPNKKDTQPYVMNALTKYGYRGEYFELVERPEEADYYVVPHEYWRLKRTRPDLLQKMIDDAQAHRKPMLIDAAGDAAGAIDVPNARVLRINQYRYELPPYEITVPVECEDLLIEYKGGTFKPRHKSTVPSVGFVGWADMPLTQRLRSLVKELPIRARSIIDPKQITKAKGVFWREWAVRAFQRSQRVKTNFIIRSAYSGHTAMVKDIHKARMEFVDNIFYSDYSLVVRGDPNASTRLYEVLSLGRIPVIIDTACVFPLERFINYRECCVIIDWRDLMRAPDILADFHAALTDEEFIAMQQKARDAFEHYLRYDKFSRYLADMLREQKPQ